MSTVCAVYLRRHLSSATLNNINLSTMKRLYGLTVMDVSDLPSYSDQNFRVVVVDQRGGGEYVLKVMNSEDSKNPTLLEVQTHAMSFLHQRGLPAQTALPTTTGQLMSLEDIDCGFGPQKYLVRLLTYLPGNTISKVPVSPQLLYEVGKMAARMDTILQKMDHPHLCKLQRDTFTWSLSNVADLERYLHHMDGEPVQDVVRAVLEQHQAWVVPQCSSFRKCINHGDFNDLNILVQPSSDTDGYKISGILDFGDMSSGYFVYELATAIAHMMIRNPEPMEVAGPVLAGWESVLPLNQAEKEALYLLVLSRFCQCVVLPKHTLSLYPGNEEYLTNITNSSVPILCQLWELGKEEMERKWFATAA